MPRAWAEIDLGAVAHNVGLLVDEISPARLCAVVKADGYGHGAPAVGRAALDAGASWLGVATAEEAGALRLAGVDAPVLLLSEPAPEEVDDIVGLRLRATVYTAGTADELAKAVVRAGADPLPVHVKIDTGMHRVGAAPEHVSEVVAAVMDRAELRLEGVWTHLAVADEPGNAFTFEQLARFDRALAGLAAAGVEAPVVHAANSAGAIAHPAARRDMVRCGIAVYGVAPAPALAGCLPLRPALALKTRVAMVKQVEAGEGISYGLHHRCDGPSLVATLPVGYADGVPRSLFRDGGEVLVGGRRRRIIGAVTMDHLMVLLGGPDDPHATAVSAGDEAVLIGAQGDERITADEWADRTGTIAYEVLCRIGPRVPRIAR